MAERWDGLRWSIQPMPSPSPPGANGFHPGSSLQSVACTSSMTCVAVGGYKLSSGYGAPLVEVWDGHRWSIQRAPIRLGALIRVCLMSRARRAEPALRLARIRASHRVPCVHSRWWSGGTGAAGFFKQSGPEGRLRLLTWRRGVHV